MSLPTCFPAKTRLFLQSRHSTMRSQGTCFAFGALPLWISLLSGGTPKLPTFVSPVSDPWALAIGTLSLPWQNLWALAFPPLKLLTKILTKLHQFNSQLLLMALAWLAQPWFPDLLDLSINHSSVEKISRGDSYRGKSPPSSLGHEIASQP